MSMTTPPKRIADEPPTFPCWVYGYRVGHGCSKNPEWRKCGLIGLHGIKATHWLPDSPEAPTEVPACSTLPPPAHPDYLIGDEGEKILVASLEPVVPSPAPESTPAAGPAEEAELRQAVRAAMNRWSIDGDGHIRDAIMATISPLLARQTEELAQAHAEVEASVPRSRYDALNADWLESQEKLKTLMTNSSTYVASELAAKDDLFKMHTEAVAEFLNELYAIVVDPLTEGVREVSETKAALLAAATRDRELIAGLRDQVEIRGQMRDEAVEAMNKAEAEIGRLRAQLASEWSDCAQLVQCALEGRECQAYSDTLDKQIQAVAALRVQLTAAESRLAEAERDKGRLDWLEEVRADIHCNTQGGWWLFTRGMEVQDRASVRILIDDSMRQIRASKPETVN